MLDGYVTLSSTPECQTLITEIIAIQAIYYFHPQMHKNILREFQFEGIY